MICLPEMRVAIDSNENNETPISIPLSSKLYFSVFKSLGIPEEKRL